LKEKQTPHDLKAACEAAGKRAQALAEKHHGCTQATLAVFLEQMKIHAPQDELLMASSSCLVGGSTQCLTCGPLLAGFMVFGIKYGRRRLEESPEILDQGLELARELTDRFIDEYGTTNCCELTGFDMRSHNQREQFMASKEAGDSCAKRIRTTTEWIAEIIAEKDN
jgi:C_GCAxxG_C_C family probable redox protein